MKSNNYQLLTVTALELETKVREDFTITKKLISNENGTQMIITDGQLIYHMVLELRLDISSLRFRSQFQPVEGKALVEAFSEIVKSSRTFVSRLYSGHRLADYGGFFPT